MRYKKFIIVNSFFGNFKNDFLNFLINGIGVSMRFVIWRIL